MPRCCGKSPETEDIKAKSETNRPVKKTARNAPGELRVAVGAPAPERMAWPMKNVRKLSSSQKTTVTAAAITAPLVASRTGRLGVAASVVRIVPLEYSLEINMTPNTPRSQGGDDHPGQWTAGSGRILSNPHFGGVPASCIASPVTKRLATRP